MIKRWIYIVTVIIAAFAVCDANAADISVSASVDTSRDVYAGDDFSYQIIIDGYDQPGQPDLSPLATFKPRSAGGGTTRRHL